MKSLKITAATAALLSSSLVLPMMAMAATYSANITSLSNYLKADQASDGSITGFGGETAWAVMGLVATGTDPHTVVNSGKSLLDFLAANAPTTTTGWERDLLAVTAAGENPFTFGGHNYVSQIQAAENSNQLGSTTGINDDTFGVLALISAGPSANQTIISKSVDFIIANQNSDGGWSYAVGNSSDNGDTAIALQALKAAKAKGFTNTGLEDALDNGMTYLTGNQNSDGGWGYAGTGGSDAGTTAWAALAFTNNAIVNNALDFIVTKQDSTSGGVDGGYGVDTYTSANSLIAFGEKAFPVGEFTGTFEETPPPSDNTQNPPQNNNPGNANANQNNNTNNQNGQVLAANTNNQGKVLAASVLPDTGIPSNLGSLVPTGGFQPKPIQVNYLLLAGLVAIEVGLVLRLLASRLEKNKVN